MLLFIVEAVALKCLGFHFGESNSSKCSLKKLGFGQYENFGIFSGGRGGQGVLQLLMAFDRWCLRSSSFCVEKFCG